MKKYFLFTSTLLILLALTSCGDEGHKKYRAYIAVNKLRLSPGSKSYIPVRVEIPGKSHIYGNPKGPGTGKATEISLEKTSLAEAKKARFLKPVKYTASGEKKHVWVYKNETTIFLPLTVRKNAPEKKKYWKFPSIFSSVTTRRVFLKSTL